MLEKGWDLVGDMQRGLYCLQRALPRCFGFKTLFKAANNPPHSEDLSGRAQLGCPSTAMLGSSQAGGVLGDRCVHGDEVHRPRSVSPVTAQNPEAAVGRAHAELPAAP